jgi:hypothetical protein
MKREEEKWTLEKKNLIFNFFGRICMALFEFTVHQKQGVQQELY